MLVDEIIELLLLIPIVISLLSWRKDGWLLEEWIWREFCGLLVPIPIEFDVIESELMMIGLDECRWILSGWIVILSELLKFDVSVIANWRKLFEFLISCQFLELYQ